MTRNDDRTWERFVIAHGYNALDSDLAFLLNKPLDDVKRLKLTGACSKSDHAKTFGELFQLWHGRDPRDEEWPPPRQAAHGGYRWQPPELALLASLVGRLANPEIAQILTERLRQITGDPNAHRSKTAVRLATNRIGMQESDVVGGITITQAGKETGSLAMINQAVHRGEIRALRIGRRWVIPYNVWAEWKAGRIFPPAHYIPLASLKQPLAIRSDKLSEFARMGYVPTAVRCNPYGTRVRSTQFGTWYIDPKAADRLIADRHAGKPMPWHGKPLPDNLRATWRLWQKRKHPNACKTCTKIWGYAGAPKTFEDYRLRYPPLAHGAKRHLTRSWTLGLTVTELAQRAGKPRKRILRAIANGTLNAVEQGGQTYVSKTAAARWIAAHCPTGDSPRSWISLATATKRYFFTAKELRAFIDQKKLKSKTGTEGAMRGIVYVSAQQCAALRQAIGFSERQAARRAGVNINAFRRTLAGVNWRGTGAIPLSTLQAVIKRLQSSPGHTIPRTAELLGTSEDWVKARIADGTVRPLRRKWQATAEIYLSAPMINRLRKALHNPRAPAAPLQDHFHLGEAALEAGVSTSTICNWANTGKLPTISGQPSRLFPREAVRERARIYWRQCRHRRIKPPRWLTEEAGAE